MAGRARPVASEATAAPDATMTPRREIFMTFPRVDGPSLSGRDICSANKVARIRREERNADFSGASPLPDDPCFPLLIDYVFS
jgi:hypothetical protein